MTISIKFIYVIAGQDFQVWIVYLAIYGTTVNLMFTFPKPISIHELKIFKINELF